MVATADISDFSKDAELKRIRDVLESVTDPEIPVLTIDEMGILSDVQLDDGVVKVTITPTYSGCPAMDQITDDVGTALAQAGYDKFEVKPSLSPAWTTDWMSEESKEKLRQYGIAPPCKTSAISDIGAAGIVAEIDLAFTPRCPQCNSLDTQVVSEFGSTACKALWKCKACLEPFDYFKPI